MRPFSTSLRGTCRNARLEGCDGRGVGDPVHPGGTEMPLERRDDVPGRAVEIAGGGDVVAVFAEPRLYFRDRRILFAEHEYRSTWGDRRGLDPKSDAGGVQHPPGKFFAGILLAGRGDIRMPQHAPGRDAVAREDAAAKGGDGRDLPLGEIRIAAAVAGIGDLDPDRARIDVGLALPYGCSRMPGPARFRHALDDVTVLHDH